MMSYVGHSKRWFDEVNGIHGLNMSAEMMKKFFMACLYDGR